MADKKSPKMTQEVIEYYIGIGYTEQHNFPDEYMLLVNPKTMEKVRVYYDSYKVWEYV
jgi:hypothetical protein